MLRRARDDRKTHYFSAFFPGDGKKPSQKSLCGKNPQEKTPQMFPVEKNPHPSLGPVEKTPHPILGSVDKTPQLYKNFKIF